MTLVGASSAWLHSFVLGRRSPEAVSALEALQQQEHQLAGEPALSEDQFVKVLRDDVAKQFVNERLATGALEDAVAQSLDDEEIDRRLSERMHEFRVGEPGQWSRYETPGARWGRADICSRVEAHFAAKDWRLPQFPVVGTLTTGQIGARTQHAADTTLILLDNGFFKYAYALAQLAVFASHDTQAGGDITGPTIQLMSDVIGAQTVMRSILFMYPRETPPALRARVHALADAICVFVIAHEYATQ